VSETDLATLLDENADEPHAELIARLLKQHALTTTQSVERVVRLGLNEALPRLSKADVKASVRRTFQALRIAVNDEFLRAGRAHARAAARARAGWPGGNHHVPLWRRSPGEEGVPGRAPRRRLCRYRARGASIVDDRNPREPPRLVGKVAVGLRAQT
jgi:hypothetical protein